MRTKTACCAVFDPTATRIAIAGGEGEVGEVKVFDTGTGKCTRSLESHNGPVWSIAFTPDGAQMATAGGDGLVRMWVENSDESQWQIANRAGAVRCVAICRNPSRPWLAWAGAGGTIQLVNYHDRELVCEFGGHKEDVYSIAFSEDGSQLISGGFDRMVRVWDTTASHLLASSPSLDRAVTSVAFTGGEEAEVVPADTGGHLSLWKIGGNALGETGSLIFPSTAILSMAVKPGGKCFTVGCENRMISTWDGKGHWTPPSKRGHVSKVTSVHYSHDGQKLVSADDRGIVKVWDTSNDGAAR